MGLSIICSATTPNGQAYLATDDRCYYVKGVYTPYRMKYDDIMDALSAYIGILTNIIEELGDGYGASICEL